MSVNNNNMKKYYGLQTEMAIKNFPFQTTRVQLEFIYAIADIKRAAAIAHEKAHELDEKIADAIVVACSEITDGKLDDQFPLPYFQGGAGTSINMNVNEVIAQRASEILQDKNVKVHPNDHVNMGQSTNDVNPSALKIASLRLGKVFLDMSRKLISSLRKKAMEYKSVPKLGRTHLQDAVPITFGDEFQSWADALSGDAIRIETVLKSFEEQNLGGTAVGNKINASKDYITHVYQELSNITGLNLRPGENLMSLTSSQTDFCALSQAITLFCLDASKIANDLRFLSSGPNGGISEIKLQELQPGSSIMPGKVNPVLPESVNQLYFMVSGNNLTIEHCAHGSQLELGVMVPILAESLLSSLKVSTEVLGNFTRQCIDTLSIDVEKTRSNLEKSTAYATLLTPTLGYDTVSSIVKESIKRGKSIRTLVYEKKLLTEKEFDTITSS
jgi:aspartate ammonia-lyase